MYAKQFATESPTVEPTITPAFASVSSGLMIKLETFLTLG
jgi:hypothetical protein